MGELTERDRAILDLEGRWWRHQQAKEQAVRDQLRLEVVAYYQIVAALIDTAEAQAYAPLTVKRLRRLRAGKQRARMARRAGR